MPWTRRLPRWLAATVAGLLSVSLVLALVDERPKPATPATAAPPAKAKESPAPLFADREAAANAPVLVLQPDDRGVLGWVAGKADAAGAKVAIRAGGKDFEATVGKDNTFRWDHAPEKATTVTARVALPGQPALVGRTVLAPALPANQHFSVFFVTDRSAYRPGHTLKFAAYFRTLNEKGEFTPVPDQEVALTLTSETRQTRAAKFTVTTDAGGRASGEYTFTDADALDHYTLTADGFTGEARVLLGEYRKSKVSLKLKGEVKDGKLTVAFQADDYLGRQIKGTAASYTATVVRTAEPDKLKLNPDEFAHHEGGPPAAEQFESLPDDERLLTLANGVSALSFAGFGSRVVGTREGTVTVPAEGAPKLTLDLHPDWLKGNHEVTVSGVFTDDMGRDNRGTATFKLDPNPTRGLKVTTPKELFAAGEKIPVSLAPFGLAAGEKPTMSLVLVRLDPQLGMPWVEVEPDPEGELLPDNTRLPALSRRPTLKPAPKAADGWKSVPVFDPVRRKIISVVPVADNAAEITVKQPGAYKLLAVAKLADGTTVQSETGVVVKSAASLPGVVLRLDSREVEAGGRLGGIVQTRFAGAKMLLTLRDSAGIRLAKPLTADARGIAVIDEPLPAGLRYGCAVCVQYPEAADVVHADQRDLFVTPTDRTLTVTTTAPVETGPGADIKLGIKVDRQEEVDLVVSVYDEALLSVTGDLAKDIRNFYLADTRGRGRAARDLAATRVGSATVAELVKVAEKLLDDKDRLAQEPGLEARLNALLSRWKERKVVSTDLVMLVRLTGFEVYLGNGSGGDEVWKVQPATRLADLFRREAEESGLHASATVIGNTVLIAFGNAGYDPWAGHRDNTYGYGFGQFGFAGQFGQFGQFGNLGGQFGLAGGPQFGFGGGFRGFGGGLGGLGFGGQGAFSQPSGGLGQFGFSQAFNRDLAPQGGAGVPAPLPGLGLGEETVRRDFADSAFWSAKLRTDKSGAATAAFKLPDSLTNWRVQVTAVSSKMHVGTGTAKIKTSRPVMIWPILPRTFTEGDTMRVFGTVHNLTDKEQAIRVKLTTENGQVLDAAEKTVTVPAKENVPVYWTFRAGTKGFADLLMSATCPGGSDASLKKLPVTAAAVVERATASGLVGKGDLKVTLPEDVDLSRATVTVTVAPTLVADLADTLPYLVEYPYGCVEQTMSRFLPALRVAHILRQSGISTHKELEAKLPRVVEAGQKRLIQLQQPDGGWGWNGNGTTHEMMTPYALFGLIAAEDAGYPCPNPNTINLGLGRLRQYLDHMGQQWDAWVVSPKKGDRHTAVNDALYCLWVYAPKADAAFLKPWWVRIEKAVGSETMSDYGHALALEVAVKSGGKDLATKLAAELRKRAKKAGDFVYWTTGGFSRWGDNTTEVTAAVMKALVAHDPADPLIPGVLAYFHGTKRGDRWDSTKDTACVLYALCDYLAAVRAGPAAAGPVKVSLNGSDDGTMKLDGPLSKSVKLTGKTLKAGENAIAVSGADAASGGALARVVVTFTRGKTADVPARDHGVKVERTISVRGADGKWAVLKNGATVPYGSYVKVSVTATPAPGLDLRYTLLESPKPAGGETVPADDPRFKPKGDFNPEYVLREDREAMTCFHYEQVGTTTAEYVVLTEFAGEFRVPPARVELMYKPTVGGHSDSFVLKVAEKK